MEEEESQQILKARIDSGEAQGVFLTVNSQIVPFCSDQMEHLTSAKRIAHRGIDNWTKVMSQLLNEAHRKNSSTSEKAKDRDEKIWILKTYIEGYESLEKMSSLFKFEQYKNYRLLDPVESAEVLDCIDYWTELCHPESLQALSNVIEIADESAASPPPETESILKHFGSRVSIIKVDKNTHWKTEKWLREEEVLRSPLASNLCNVNFPGVYVYSYPRYLSAREDGKFLLKVGMSLNSVERRVKDQGRSAEIPEDIVALRAFKTEFPRELESFLHRALKHESNHNQLGGREWFWSTPEEIEEIVRERHPLMVTFYGEWEAK